MRTGRTKGSIYFDKSRQLWKAAVTDPYGRRLQRRFSTPLEAEEWLASVEAEVASGTYTRQTELTVGQWIQEYLEIYCKPNIRLKTYVGYLQTASYLAPLSAIPLRKLAAHQVQRFYLTLTNISDSYRFKVHRLLKAAVSKAAATELIPKNPMLAVVPPKVAHKEVQIFTKAELAAIVGYLRTEPAHRLRMYPLVATALETGARLGELIGLKAGDIRSHAVHINASVTDVLGRPIEQPPKTAAGRRAISIGFQLEALLKSVIAERRLAPNAYLFGTAKGGPLSTRNIERSWRAMLGKAGVKYKKFHTLRHTNASMLLASGVPVLEVAARLGHSRPAHTFNLYGHALPDNGREVAEKASAVMGVWI